MYEMHVKRKTTESIERRRLAMIAGVWANPDFGGEARAPLLEEIEDELDGIIDGIYGSPRPEPEPEIDFDDPLFGATKRTIYAVPLTDEEREMERARQQALQQNDQSESPARLLRDIDQD